MTLLLREVNAPAASVPPLPREQCAQLAALLAPLGTLEQVLMLSRQQQPPLQLVDLVVQDEYTHDVVLSFYDGHYLVFDTT